MKKREILVKFGKRVREERKKLRYSQEFLSVEIGCHRTYVGMIERGEKNLTLTNIYKFAGALGMRISELTEGL